VFGICPCSQVATVNVTGDTAVEVNETFTVDLSDASGALIDTATATGTILNDDAATLSIGNVSVLEGGELVFTVTLSHAVQGGSWRPCPSSQPVSWQAGMEFLRSVIPA
jgi:hypothetical protein